PSAACRSRSAANATAPPTATGPPTAPSPVPRCPSTWRPTRPASAWRCCGPRRWANCGPRSPRPAPRTARRACTSRPTRRPPLPPPRRGGTCRWPRWPAARRPSGPASSTSARSPSAAATCRTPRLPKGPSQHMKTISHFIGGKPVEGTSGRFGPVWNPATGVQEKQVAFATADEVDAAVAAAKDAFTTWGASSLARRTAILFKYRELLDAHRDEIAALITAEHGKVHSDALGEVARGMEIVELACGISVQLKGELSTQVSTRVDVASIRQPLGVVAGITPFNFPAMVPMWMFPLAIACGNTFVLKPSEKDPSASLRLAELAAEAGLPDGVLNVVQGAREAVDRLLEHPDVEAVSFVGSTPIARHIQLRAVEHGKRVQALGGAKNHMLVLPDADLDLAADQAINAAYGSAGERCMAVSVVVAVGGIGDDLAGRIAERARKLRVGPGDDPASEMGPLITREHRDKVASYVAGAAAQGAEVVVDGTDLTVEGH